MTGYGGGGDEKQNDSNDTTKTSTDDTFDTYDTYDTYDNYDDDKKDEYEDDEDDEEEDVYCSAKGELWKFNSRKEIFKLLVDDIKAIIIESSNDYSSQLKITRKTGQTLLSQTVSNDLQIQFNKVSFLHSFFIFFIRFWIW